jgi:2-succinyl-5-enolpyruvyl-6-hydroxy-3-cyclohexene-1-carboxylate synthase
VVGESDPCRLSEVSGDEPVNQSTTLARSLARGLIELGVSDVVLSPGSRSAPLTIAFGEARDRGLIRIHVRIDERSAAFFALGLSKATNRYVPVLCTSGSAVANFYPAFIEAFQSDIKLLALTADRPERLRKTGANQTTLQAGFFGQFATRSIDTATPIELSHILAGNSRSSGPIHINLQFDEPLLPDDESDWLAGVKVIPISEKVFIPADIAINQKQVALIIGHDRAGFSVEDINEFARDLKAVVVSEDPISFEGAIAHAPIILSDEKVREKLKADLAVVIGRTTLTRSINTYINSAKRIMVIDPRTSDIDTRRSADEIHHVIPNVIRSEADPSWRNEWLTYSDLARTAISASAEWSEGRIAAAVAQTEVDALYIASSRPIRDVEAFALANPSVSVFANRGLAGIDGNISTAMGIATQFNKTLALIGDLALFHDISALTNEIRENLTIVVVDNNGGGIFSTLPQRGVANFEEFFGTPHNKSIKKIASAFGIKSIEVESVADLLAEIASSNQKGVKVIVAKAPLREFNADNLKTIMESFSKLVN